jgi:peptidoglycan/xylan/chitin deacetylase (PgdA/CDA1 family)
MLVLTFHSVSNEVRGPIGITPATFAMQMRALAEAGYRSLTVAELLAWHEGREPRADLAGRKVLITFDDAYCDFAANAVPAILEHGFTAVNFVPSALVGRAAEWAGAMQPARAIMPWALLRELRTAGMEFGAHGRTHANLTQLSPREREYEIATARVELEDGLGTEVTSFAAPYGAVNRPIMEAIRRHYRAGFGVRLATASRRDDRSDLPRIDMHYFRAERPWRNLLGGGRTYLRARAFARGVRARLVA